MVIRPATPEDLPRLNQHAHLWGPPDYHERQIRVKAPYERLGYQDWGHGLYMIQWDRYDEQGNKETVEEQCVYLVKELIDWRI